MLPIHVFDPGSFMASNERRNIVDRFRNMINMIYDTNDLFWRTI